MRKNLIERGKINLDKKKCYPGRKVKEKLQNKPRMLLQQLIIQCPH